MKVRRNRTAELKVRKLLAGERHKPTTFSVTRLTCCPRKTYLRMLGIAEVVPEGRELVFTRGRAHHELLEVYRPNEVRISKDGIRGDIDMIGTRITEIYTTTISSKKVKCLEDVPKVFPLKVSQLMAYLYMMDELEGDLLVFFLFGDYTRLKTLPNGRVRYTGIIPELRDWTIEFERRELERNWNELLAKRDVIRECLSFGVQKAVLKLIPKVAELWQLWIEGKLSDVYRLIGARDVVFKYLHLPDWTGYDFECKNCGYAYICPRWNKEVSESE